MKLATRLGVAILGVAAFPALARAERVTTFLDDLETRIIELDEGLPEPSTPAEVRRKRVLTDARAVLGFEAGFFDRELGIQEDLLRVLAPAFRGDAEMRDLVDHTMNLYQARLAARRDELAAMPVSDQMTLAAYTRAHRVLERLADRFGSPGMGAGSWRARARRLVVLAGDLDRAAALLRDDRGIVPVEGTLTVSIDGVPTEFRICTAVNRGGPSPEFVLTAFAAEGNLFLETKRLQDPAPGRVWPDIVPLQPSGEIRIGEVRMVGESGYPAFYGERDTVRWSAVPEDPSPNFTLAAFDAGAGTASGSFQFEMSVSDRSETVQVAGSFDITAGMLSY